MQPLWLQVAWLGLLPWGQTSWCWAGVLCCQGARDRLESHAAGELAPVSFGPQVLQTLEGKETKPRSSESWAGSGGLW